MAKPWDVICETRETLGATITDSEAFSKLAH